MMANIVLRDNFIYREIESFEEYELTQCVAYEMMIGDHKEMEYINDTIAEISKHSKDISDLKENIFSDTQEATEIQVEIVNKVRQIYNLFNSIHIEPYNISQLRSLYVLPILTETNKTFLEEYIDDRESSMTYEDDTLEQYLNMEQSFDDGYCDYETLELEGYSIKTKSVVDNAFDFYCDLDNVKYEYRNPVTATLMGYIHNTEVTITPNFKRKIDFNWVYVRNAMVELNFALPKNELIAYISKMKDDFNWDNTIISTPLEVLGEELEKASFVKNYPKKPKAEVFADMFFVYDYVTTRLDQIKSMNEEAARIRDEEISLVNTNKYTDSSDKKTQRVKIMEEYSGNKSDIKIEDIFAEKNLLAGLGLKSSSSKSYYYIMQSYIDRLKYQELITGVTPV